MDNINTPTNNDSQTDNPKASIIQEISQYHIPSSEQILQWVETRIQNSPNKNNPDAMLQEILDDIKPLIGQSQYITSEVEKLQQQETQPSQPQFQEQGQ